MSIIIICCDRINVNIDIKYMKNIGILKEYNLKDGDFIKFKYIESKIMNYIKKYFENQLDFMKLDSYDLINLGSRASCLDIEDLEAKISKIISLSIKYSNKSSEFMKEFFLINQ